MCSPKMKLLQYIRYKFIFKSEETIQSNRLADQVRKRRPPSYFAVATWTSNCILYFYHALDVSGQKIEMDLVEVSIFYKSE